ncbi:hypothetical protein HMPREF9389_0595 [Streptococcus sanguinis SK355]|uniref:Uncharacterized protein n=1 Tax=Streptococcus sanguinis SK355 TaxID=888816 RepID=F3UP37_STRSA|nr:hypothetical protein HMPREF9389_0595 [Streptococcus sanguinis SK355]
MIAIIIVGFSLLLFEWIVPILEKNNQDLPNLLSFSNKFSE